MPSPHNCSTAHADRRVPAGVAPNLPLQHTMRPWSLTTVVFLAASTVTALVCWALWVFVMQPTGEAVKTANQLHDRFLVEFPISPRIAASAGTLFSQTSRASEFVLLESSGTAVETLEGLLPQGGELVVESSYTATTGIRAREHFQLDVRSGGKIVDCTLPQPRVLTVELGDPQIRKPAGMDWKTLSEKQRHRALRTLERGARRLLQEEQSPRKAREALEALVEGILHSEHCEPVFPAGGTPLSPDSDHGKPLG